MNNALFTDPGQKLSLTFLSNSFSYKLAYDIKFDTPIRGHHVYKKIWTPRKDDILYCKKDYRSEALGYR